MSLLSVYYLLPIDLPTPSGQGKIEWGWNNFDKLEAIFSLGNDDDLVSKLTCNNICSPVATIFPSSVSKIWNNLSFFPDASKTWY